MSYTTLMEYPEALDELEGMMDGYETDIGTALYSARWTLNRLTEEGIDTPDALSAALDILQRLRLEGIKSLEGLQDILDDYHGLAVMYQAMREKYEQKEAPTVSDGVYHCPACHGRVSLNHSHCHRCGKALKWKDTPGRLKHGDGEPTPEQAADAFEREAVQGFIIAECGACGSQRPFCTRTPITQNRCKICGHVTDLNRQELRPAYAKCVCDREFKYRTNATTDEITISCIACGEPITMRRTDQGTAYTTRTAEPWKD